MSTRLTSTMMSRNVLRDLNNSADRLEHTRAKASSGKQITRPSDDPFAAARALKFRESLDGTRQHLRNASDAIGWQEVSEQALNNLTGVVARVKEIVVAGANDTNGPSARAALATEVIQRIGEAKEQGNVSYAGRYVFSGTLTTTPPFTTADDLYHGDAAGIAREIGPGVSLTINQLGSTVLGNGAASDLLGTLRSVVTHLQTGDGASLRNLDLAALDGHLDKLLEVRADNGANSTRIEAAVSRLNQFEETTLGQLSKTEDADFAKVLIELNSQQAAYQSALRAGANIVQTSLMDFLR